MPLLFGAEQSLLARKRELASTKICGDASRLQARGSLISATCRDNVRVFQIDNSLAARAIQMGNARILFGKPIKVVYLLLTLTDYVAMVCNVSKTHYHLEWNESFHGFFISNIFPLPLSNCVLIVFHILCFDCFELFPFTFIKFLQLFLDRPVL